MSKGGPKRDAPARSGVLLDRRLAAQTPAEAVSPTTVLNLEGGKVEAQRRTIRKLAKALEVDPAELVEN